MTKFRACLILCSVCCLFGQSTLAQRFLTHKDATFPQIAVGPTIETQITLTNRGTADYEGTLFFSRGKGEEWNPLFNGQQLTNGALNVLLQRDTTLTVTLGAPDAETVSGGATLVSFTPLADNFIEATLTYFIRQGNQTVDAVGVLPAEEFYLASVPFEDFSTIAVALFNSAAFGAAAREVRLTLVNARSELVARETITLAEGEHLARFLTEIFPEVEMTRGKVEIDTRQIGSSAPEPLTGTALALTNGQLSALPLSPAPVGYDFTMTTAEGITIEGTLALWADSYFVRGFLRITSVDGQAPEQGEFLFFEAGGSLANSLLTVSVPVNQQVLFDDPSLERDATLVLRAEGFGFDLSDVSADWVLLRDLDQPEPLSGGFELSRTTP